MNKFILLLLLISTTLIAQNTTDIILKTNGDEMIGKVKAISDETVDFVYQNESVTYHVKVVDIVKINFTSGRIQFFNKFDAKDKPKASLEDHHNKVAILPFGFIKDQQVGSNAMFNKIQEESYTTFKEHAGGLQFQLPRTTNTLLIKAGVAVCMLYHEHVRNVIVTGIT